MENSYYEVNSNRNCLIYISILNINPCLVCVSKSSKNHGSLISIKNHDDNKFSFIKFSASIKTGLGKMGYLVEICYRSVEPTQLYFKGVYINF